MTSQLEPLDYVKNTKPVDYGNSSEIIVNLGGKVHHFMSWNSEIMASSYLLSIINSQLRKLRPALAHNKSLTN